VRAAPVVTLRAPMPQSTTTDVTGERRGQVLAMVRELLAEGRVDEALAVVAKLVVRNGELERRLAELSSRSRKREGVSSAQLLLLLDGLAATGDSGRDEADERLRAASEIDAKPEPTTEPRKSPAMRQPAPPNLRRIENPIRVPDDQRACPTCGGERKCIGHDVSEVVELIPAEVVVRLDQREKLACEKCEGELVRAPAGDKVVPAGRMGTTLVAQLLVDKYRDGLPLHRQKQRFEQLGLPVSVSTLADQVTWATDALRPLWRAAMAEVLGAKVMHLDSTSLPVLDGQTSKGIKLGALWGYVGGEGDAWTALYLYASTGKKVGQREGELGPEDVLGLRKGYTVADASTLFEKSFQREELIECGCNMHARRYFTRALDAGDVRAALPLAAFKKLYQVEAEVRDRDAALRVAERQSRSRPVYDELSTWCRAHRPHEPPSSPLGKAIGYLLNNEDALRRFLDDGVVPIDNGIVERLHVRTALTRKNYLFAGSDAGAERAAVAYTILGCCALADVDPVDYLRTILPALGRPIRLVDVPAMLPARWKLARAGMPAAPSA
jgi:transposase